MQKEWHKRVHSQDAVFLFFYVMIMDDEINNNVYFM